MNWLDLHMHSNKSNDGELTPKELVKKCFESGLKVISLTDHNSIRGVLEAIEYGKEIGVEVITGVELDCSFNEYNLHVLGYGIEVPNIKINKIEEDIVNKEKKASKHIIEKISRLGISFELNEVMSLAIDGVVTGEMIAEVALKDSRNKDNELLMPYFEGGKRSSNPYVNFYWDFCSKGKPAYVPIEFITLKEAIEIVIESGGIPVLAHPGMNIGCDEKIIESIIEAGIKGVEVYSSYHNLETIDFYNKIADKYNVIKTIGSDYHGKIKPTIQLGKANWLSNEKEIYKNIIH